MHRDKRFWVVVVVFLIGIISNAYIAQQAVSQNQERISALETERHTDDVYIRETIVKIEAASRETSNKVVEALTGLTTVISERSANDQRVLKLLEAIYSKLNTENSRVN